ncbi:DMT family transporter [Bacteroidota bacterium]
MKLDNKTKSAIFTLTAVFFWSTVATAFKLTLQGMTFGQLLFYSSVSSCIVLFFFAYYNAPGELFDLLKGKSFAKNILLGLLNPFLYYLVLFKAYSLLPAQEAQPVNYTWPIAIAIFSAIFLKQKLTPKIILGLFLAFVGVLIIATRGDVLGLKFHNMLGGTLATGSSLIWASFWTLKLLDKRDDAVKLFGAFLVGSVLTGTYVALFDSFVIENKIYLLGAVYSGFFEMGVTYFLFMKGLQLSTNKAKTSTFAFLSPFVSLVFIAFILGEEIFTSSIAGLVFIVSGILVQQIGRKE